MFYKKFNINKNNIVTLTGAGGKTSLLFKLAEELKTLGKVLITTTTQIKIPNIKQYQRYIVGDKIFHGKNNNIDIIGSEIKNDKLIGIDYEKIFHLKKKYHYILIEGDGAKGKFLKFWNDNEPCIHPESNKVIGLLNTNMLNVEISKDNIHRFNLYKNQLDNFNAKEKINKDNFDSFFNFYFKNNKFFKSYDGEKYIFCNGIDNFYNDDTISRFNLALNLKNIIDNNFDNIDYLIGSVKDNFIVRPQCNIVILASGFSKRYGIDNKLQLKINEVSLLEILLKKLDIPTFNKILVGKDGFSQNLAKKYNCTYVCNKNAHLGQSQSIKLGVEKITSPVFGIFPGDQPLLTKEIILILYLESLKSNMITIPVANNKRFSPIFFPQNLKDKFQLLEGDVGGKEIIKKEKNINLVNFNDEKYFMDIDTKEDYERVLKLYE